MDKRSYSIQDGYKISNMHGMVYDDDGWLWMVGIASNAEEFKLSTRRFVMQRYDGQSLHDVKLPFTNHKGPLHFLFLKTNQNKLILGGYCNDQFTIYELNPKNLKISKLSQAQEVVRDCSVLQVFNMGNDILFFSQKRDQVIIYKMSPDAKITPYGNVAYEGEKTLHFKNLVEYKNHFLINNSRSGILCFNKNGQFVKQLALKSSPNKKLLINSWYRSEKILILNLADLPSQYTFDEEILELVPIPKSNALNYDFFVQDNKGNRFEYFSKNQNIIARRILNNNPTPIYDSLHLQLDASVASRNLNRELVIANGDQLEHLFFANNNVKTYLENYSIRGILQESKHGLLVATEANGWYRINTLTDEVIPFNTWLNGKPIILSSNRAIFNDGQFYWSNYEDGIVKINKQNGSVFPTIYYPVECMTSDDKYIYYGTNLHNLMRFDKKVMQNKILSATDTLYVLDITRDNHTLYAACNKGLLIYKNDKLNMIAPNNDEDLLSVDFTSDYGLLVGSKNGNLYQYNEENGSFRLLYRDEKKASIASVLIDRQKQIWLNTFAGIVCFNPFYKQATRFGQEDGLSHYECNRHSAFQTNEGDFVVGTIKGLNIFTPQLLSKNNQDLYPRILAITSYKKKAKQVQTIYSLNALDSTKKVVLPSLHNSLRIHVGMLEIVNHNEIKFQYRLNKKEWLQPSHQNEIQLINLSPGTYELEIEAMNVLRGKLGKTIRLEIIAERIFYKQWWFLCLLLGGLGSLLYYMYYQLKQKNKLQSQLSKNLILGQEEERKRLAKDLHDGIGQQLILLKRKAQNERIESFSQMTGELLEEMRNITRALHPVALKNVGLTQALQDLVNRADGLTNILFTVEIESIDGILSSDNELNLYRFVQESLNNIIKHANCTAAEVDIFCMQNFITLRIADNGKGFDTTRNTNSLGIDTLKERINILNGTFELKSSEGEGTIVRATIPIINE
ncbi:MAG: histidine kinase [Chitinophagaceae bacterium]